MLTQNWCIDFLVFNKIGVADSFLWISATPLRVRLPASLKSTTLALYHTQILKHHFSLRPIPLTKIEKALLIKRENLAKNDEVQTDKISVV